MSFELNFAKATTSAATIVRHNFVLQFVKIGYNVFGGLNNKSNGWFYHFIANYSVK